MIRGAYIGSRWFEVEWLVLAALIAARKERSK